MEDNHADGVVKKNKNVDSIFTLFSNLTGEKNKNPKYCVELIQTLGNQFNVGSGTNLKYSLKRIVRGLGSTRLYSQCGCFAALTCVLKYQACSVEDVIGVLEKEQQPVPGATKAEMKALNTGCVLACGAIIHSGLFASQSPETQQNILQKLIEAGKKKSYFSSVIYRFLVDVVNLLDSLQFKEVFWPIVKSDLLKNLNECGADAYYLLLVCLKKNSKIVNKYLEKNSTSSDEIVKKILNFLLNNSVKSDHPIFESVVQVFCSNDESDVELWVNLVNESSKGKIHKDTVLITLFFHIINNIKTGQIVPSLLVPKFIETIMKVLSIKKGKTSKDEGISGIARSALNSMTTLLCSKETSDEVRFKTIKKLLLYPSNLRFEKKTEIKCIHLLASNLNEKFIKKLLNIYKEIISGESKKIIDEDKNEEIWSNKDKQQALHVFTKTLNHPNLKKDMTWKLDQIKFILDIGFLKKFQLACDVQKCAKECFYKAVMLQMPSLKELVTLLDELATHLNENIKSKNFKVSEEVLNLWDKMFSAAQNLKKKDNNKVFIAVHVFLIYMGFHLFLDSELAKSGIEELLSCYSRLKEVHKKKKKKDDEDDPHWAEVTVDLILSLLSRENRLWRHVVSCVFPQVVPHITPTALHQIIEALDPKSQNNILRHVDSDGSESEEGEEEEEEDGDVEEESGEGSESSELEESDIEEYDDEAKENDQLRLAVRNALGYSAAAMTDEESIDMDQMGEEEEKRLNENLAQAFRLFRSKSKGKKKKQTKEEEALTHFRLRVLDLVEIYINNSPSMGGCLDLILPLLDILEMSIKDYHQRPLQNRVDLILKHISTVKNFSNLENVTQTVIKDIFEAVTSRKEIPALVFVEMSPRISDCATFLVRSSQLVPKEGDDIPLVNEYDELLRAFVQSRDFKLPISMFQSVLRMCWKGNFKLVETLFEFLTLANIRIFKKMKIIELLRMFYKNDKLHSTCEDTFKAELNAIETTFINNFVILVSEYDKNEMKSKEKIYLSFFSNVIMLINVIHTCFKRHRQKTKNCPPWKNLIRKIAELDAINWNKKTRSQLATIANVWKVALPASEGKRKRTVSESSGQKGENRAENGKEEEEREEDEEEDEEEEEVSSQPKKKKKTKMSKETVVLKRESRKMREEISSSGLEMIRFSTVNCHSLPEPETEQGEEKEGEEEEQVEIKPKKRKLKHYNRF